MPDIDYFEQMAHVSNPLREPILRSAIEALQFPLGSRGLDAGCGIGLQALLLAETVGPVGHITGLDLSPAVPGLRKGHSQEGWLVGEDFLPRRRHK